jgi:endonuclease/exonuclease/phosphatase family metal-dependent hydrolase
MTPGPETANEMDAIDRLTVVTYNIRAAIGLGPFPPSWWERVDLDRLERISRVIADLDPDIVALQELPLMTVNGVVTDMAGELGRMLGMESRYGAVHHVTAIDRHTRAAIGAYTWGNAVLSRRPIVATRTEPLPIPADDDVVEPGGSAHELAGARFRDVEPGMREARCAVVCDIDAAQGPVHVVSTHLAYVGTDQRTRQAEAIAAIVSSLDGPVVLLGDLNAPIHASELAPLRQPLVDAFLAIGIPPVDERRLSCGDAAIDHVLVRGLTPVSCRVAAEAGDASDHWPVVAVLER